MQKEKVKDRRRKDGSRWGFVRDIECVCGYIATFETWRFVCPDCGRKHYLFSNTVNLPNTACTGLAPTGAQVSEGSTGASQ